MNTAFKTFPKGSVISVVGAGGKTTLIHQLSDHYRKMGYRVLVTTSTHMMAEDETCQDLTSIKEKLDRDGYAFAGIVEEKKGLRKVAILPSDVLKSAIEAADIALIEADGSRHMPFKVPYAHEPVLVEETTHIILVGGMQAVGQPLANVTYNAEAALALGLIDENGLPVGPDTKLTPQLMGRIYKLTFGKYLKEHFPDAALFLHEGWDIQNEEEPGEEDQTFSEKASLFKEAYESTLIQEERPTFHLIFLSAGFSKRFGGNKLLTAYQGKELYRHLLDRLLELLQIRKDCDLTVVTQYDSIRDYANSRGLNVTINPDPSRGQSSSVKCGIAAVGEVSEEDYYIFFTGDQPFLENESIGNFLDQLKERKPLIGGYYMEGRYRNPGAFSAKLREELMALTGDKGARPLFMKYGEQGYGFKDFKAVELRDLDLPEDFKE